MISNAIKNCHHNTKIYLNYKKIRYNNKDWGEFSCINYGAPILPKDITNVYKLFYQGGNAKNTGLGAGLYIVKKIVEAHEGIVIHPACEKISRFNLGMVGPYLRCNDFKDDAMKDAVQKEILRIDQRSVDKYNEIVYSSRQKFPSIVIKDYINLPTYKIHFKTLIPIA